MGEEVEQLRVIWSFSHDSEVVDTTDDALAKVPHPDAMTIFRW